MIISIHIGAHSTNGAQLMRGLLKNKAVLAEHGVAVPNPARYRDVLPDVMRRVKSDRATPETQEMLLDQMLDTDECARLVLSYEDVICLPVFIFEKGGLYQKANFKLPWLRNVFADHDVEFFLGLRNPATFIPEAFAQCGPQVTFESFLNDTDLETLRWSDLIALIRESCPDAAITCFAYEDTPLTWAQIMRDMAGIGPMVPISGGLDILATIMKREGMKRLRTYLNTHRPQNEVQRRRILSAFLDKYVDEEAIEAEIDLPGWDEALIERLTELYEDDLERIEAMEGVHFIAP
ncbi:hypothetical protein [Celeribacter baekdonensis]|uniref:Sulfotransferase family protein n=1 Tax=Celeribacter baekdonensis TaxID=875171 RepID=A0A2R4M3D8_9RHOB|nr:hypothetical protein [Celeribacter baekdonensis]AVW91562.1 hypothetical protein DA792_11130 [Celeribacter baekdonensis]|tara:strand:+ start:2690 stop:3568 length:879 start_codon:yes stop_codon:yes gene_type:complete